MSSVVGALCVSAGLAGTVLPSALRSLRRRRLRFSARRAAQGSPRVGGHFFVVVNPHAGAGDGLIVYEEVVRPMLSSAGATHEVAFTCGPGDAQILCADAAARAESSRPQCIISVGGDGVLHECLNGLLAAHREGGGVAPRTSLPLAVVPAGSGNGVADSLYGRGATAVEAIAAVLGGSPQPVDVMALRYPGSETPERLTFDLHFLCWAVFGDHDYLTENAL